MATSPATRTQWTLDPVHSNLQFAVRHLMISNVRGGFSKVSGTATLDESDWTQSEVSVEIEASSLDTRDPQRDEHLRSADFFDVAKFPLIKFHSTRITPQGDDFALTGQLEIHGVSREVTLTMEAPGAAGKDPWGNQRRGFQATGEINRKDFGLEWNMALEAGGFAVGDKVKLTLEVEMVQSA